MEQLQDTIGQIGKSVLLLVIGAFGAEEHRCLVLGQEAHQGQQMTSQLEGIMRQVAELLHRVDEDAFGCLLADGFRDGLGDGAPLDLRRREQVVRASGREVLCRGVQIQGVYPVDVQLTCARIVQDLPRVLAQRDQETTLPFPAAGSREMQAHRGLARTGATFDEHAAMGKVATIQQGVEARDTGTQARRVGWHGFRAAEGRHRWLGPPGRNLLAVRPLP